MDGGASASPRPQAQRVPPLSCSATRTGAGAGAAPASSSKVTRNSGAGRASPRRRSSYSRALASSLRRDAAARSSSSSSSRARRASRRRGRFRPAESRSSASVLRRDAVPRAYFPLPPAAAAVIDAAKTSSFSAPIDVLGAAIFLAFLGRSVDSVFQPSDAIPSIWRAVRPRAGCLGVRGVCWGRAAGMMPLTQCLGANGQVQIRAFEQL
mmetsp:Transcript_17457/g.45830  ORF Transcript_17457/g.45830 Transcript_17457/m.45830 type:complete len:210 (+) Transcript_17457:212-841(+)